MNYKAHIFLDGEMVFRGVIEYAPRVGDTMRFSEERYGVVSEFVWCLDEHCGPLQRVNIGLIKS